MERNGFLHIYFDIIRFRQLDLATVLSLSAIMFPATIWNVGK